MLSAEVGNLESPPIPMSIAVDVVVVSPEQQFSAPEVV
jgi:hypothetical protein